MLIKLTGGVLYDPTHRIDGEVRDIFMRDGCIVAPPAGDRRVDEEYDLRGKVVMAGAIDLHTHIGGGKVNIARTMLPEDHRRHLIASTPLTRSGCGHAAPSTLTTGYRYAEMGYTTCIEPAVLPVNARQAHMEMADTPIVDTGGYVMLGSDDFFLRLFAEGAGQAAFNDYVAWTLDASHCLGVKVVNPGGINAFKFNVRRLDVDEAGPHYGARPRDIIRILSRALEELGVPHPLHIHSSNLGVPGNFESTLATMDAAEGMPIHLTHIQFHSYGSEGERKFSSAAAQIAERINAHPHISADVGQIMFGQTVTASGDSMMQYRNRHHANPKKWTVMDIECDAGCGLVPFRYRDKNFVNALQWAIGLELFLLVDDPWRIFLTTDHPNGAPFYSYPHLIRLLMDRSFRNDKLAEIHPDAAAASNLGSIEREYSLYEMAILTRAAPARILGLANKGHLGPGADADVVVYAPGEDRERMFATPVLVFKKGDLVAREGKIVKVVGGVTHAVKPAYDSAVERSLSAYFDEYLTMKLSNFKISRDEMAEHIGSPVVVHPCSRERRA